ncbi:olfactory receptor 6N2-like [Seriola lalandi dorsalis]|uniref:Olfactory receptor n=1 Tax=Seriola lalandi dorsalis TaxID=1841481 RepID=A0A3B4Y5B6_SERLL|nr:olfactory receptor 6N2-like [Seriola lalandi dorsalis]XP_056245491.1 olfactory receptor 6N2-like [Seriola aureovittata]
MDDEFNVTFVTLGGYVEVDKYRYIYFIIIFMVYILIICSNSTIVYLICIHQNLHEPMYIFIAALLINSVLLSTVIYPKLLIDFLSEKQIISYSACLFQFHIFYSLGGSEFLLLAAMAYDRYVSICKPLQYPTIMRKTTVSIFLILAWLLPASQVAVPAGLSANKKLCSFTLKAVFCNNTVYKLQCVVSSAQIIHDMVILLNIALLPVLFILFTYTRILIISYRSSREVRKKAAQTCLPHLLVLINFSCLCAYDVITVQLESDFPKTVRLIMTLQIVMYHPLFNPIMYGLKMKEISKHLKRLFFPAKII